MARRHRDALQVLVADIVSGTRPEGQQLPRETDLAAEFGVSRGVVREVIRGLEDRHLVKVVHGVGATVQDADAWDMLDPDVLAAVLQSSQGPDVLAEYLECRRIMEIEAAGLAAERATEVDLERMSEAMARMEVGAARPPSDAAERLFHEADLAFHAALIGATGNRVMAGVVGRIQVALLTARYPTARPEYRQERALPEHRAILKAVAAGNPRAARKAMAAHLDTVGEYLREYSGQHAGASSS
jgi:GntR family transcriptional repressor for pyruvate dehydrogenase complex